MKTFKLGYLALLLSLFLSGCYSYSQIRGNINGVMPVEGTIINYISIGRSNVYIHTADWKMLCSGVILPTYTPNGSFTCDELNGSITLECNNGRVLVGDWVAVDCSQGYGLAHTDHGAIFKFVYFPSGHNYCPEMPTFTD
jgi:hypothetical protein